MSWEQHANPRAPTYDAAGQWSSKEQLDNERSVLKLTDLNDSSTNLVATGPDYRRRRQQQQEQREDPSGTSTSLETAFSSSHRSDPLTTNDDLPQVHPVASYGHHGAETYVRDTPEAFRVPQSPVKGEKRAFEEVEHQHTSRGQQRARKRPRIAANWWKGISSSHSDPVLETGTPPSPLFFSNNPEQHRPLLPNRYSSSEASAKMLSKTQGEEKAVKTVKLARGRPTAASTSPLSSRPETRRRQSSGKSSTGRTDPSTPGSELQTSSAGLLASIGITELLDRDARPSFVVDLHDTANVSRSGLHFLFMNRGLRQNFELVDREVNRASPSTSRPKTPQAASPFKCWVLGRSIEGQALKKQPATFSQSDVIWSCSTLRKRLRVVSATLVSKYRDSTPVFEPSPGSSNAATEEPLTSPARDDQVRSVPLLESPQQEPKDYFSVFPGSAQAQKLDDRQHQSDTSDNVVRSLIPSTPSGEGLKPTTSDSRSHSRSQARSDESNTSLARYPAEEVLSAACASGFDAVHVPEDKEIGFFDWTRLPASDNLPQHIRFARNVDWSATALGPIEDWSPDLRQMCNLVMASPHPAAMYWGDDLTAIYNEAYVMLAGQKHPSLMGKSYREAWSEIWTDVEEVFTNAQTTGQSTMKDDDCLFIKRNDFLEETYFSWSIIPMVGGDGTVMGLYNPAFEKSRRKIAERRMLTLREVGERTASARDVKGFWQSVLAALDCNEFDTPFVMLYSLHGGESDGTENSSAHSSRTGLSTTKQCHLEGTLGVPPNHPAAPSSADLQGSEGFAPILREVAKTNKPTMLDSMNGEIPDHLLHGLDQRGFHDPVKSIVVCPIQPTTGESTLGFLVMGVNPRKPFDEDYNLFVQLLSRQLATSIASVVLFEEEIERGQQAAKLAALDRIQLSEQLAARTQEARESETKFTRMAEFVPVGVFIGASDGSLTYCNDYWYEITRVPPNDASNWIDYVMDEDRPRVEQLWRDLIEHRNPASAEFRFKASWTDRSGARGDSWVIFSAYPEKTRDGKLQSVFGSITNISTQKWAEGLQKRKMEEAVELKRQQENFIDITSHEMRNPLSAILQCADEIILSLGEQKKAAAREPERLNFALMLESNIDAAHTIALCAQHQKRIVDDILTMSKLDSALLMVTPVDVQPVAVAQRTLRMFEGEVQSADIDMKFSIDESYHALNVDWCRLDPSRVLQCLINLTGNAIKFTSAEKKRTIAITVAASKERFSQHQNPVVEYFPPRSSEDKENRGADWGDGEEIYIQFAVQDTGRGLSADEKKLLFLRFSQASPRTHVQYGGSGLGLFISRQLSELQGGEIGVASEEGKGSTFAFFVKARKSEAPSHAAEYTPSKQTKTALEEKIKGQGSPSSKAQSLVTDGSVSQEASSSSAATKAPLKVLIVEDNLVNQKVLQKQLRNLGCVTHVANHGGEALDRLRESWFWSAAEQRKDPLQLDVVLMDQEMPVMDGLTCTREIRDLEEQGKLRSHVPVIAVTANAREEQVRTAMSAGMDDVVSKPFRIPELIPKIEELVGRYPMP